MTRDEAQALLVQMLLERVRQDQFPSMTHLDLIEEWIPTALIPDYVEILMDKVDDGDYPSMPMLRRLRRAAAALPRDEEGD
jgi:hypothetical protein